jgi:hypothetical protein
MGGGLDGWLREWTDECLDIWMHVLMDGWMLDRWMNG